MTWQPVPHTRRERKTKNLFCVFRLLLTTIRRRRMPSWACGLVELDLPRQTLTLRKFRSAELAMRSQVEDLVDQTHGEG